MNLFDVSLRSETTERNRQLITVIRIPQPLYPEISALRRNFALAKLLEFLLY